MKIDFTKMTVEELKERGWRWWDEDVILMPTSEFEFLENGDLFYGLYGESIEIGKDEKLEDLDDDTRCGCSAYGLHVDQLLEKVI